MKPYSPFVWCCWVAGCADDDDWCGFDGSYLVGGAGEFVFSRWG